MGAIITPPFRIPEGFGVGKFDASRNLRYHDVAGWSSLVARWAHNPKVVGSNPTPATNSSVRRPNKPHSPSIMYPAGASGVGTTRISVACSASNARPAQCIPGLYRGWGHSPGAGAGFTLLIDSTRQPPPSLYVTTNQSRSGTGCANPRHLGASIVNAMLPETAATFVYRTAVPWPDFFLHFSAKAIRS